MTALQTVEMEAIKIQYRLNGKRELRHMTIIMELSREPK